ncbi:hypothetical protein B0T21DRAFT_358546 [Apiosordaria backusii]|uniref:Uncharacterized protein n=1 Tax=Apiosordaria backusii TaxID=314023 RepID=A0AA40ESS9_9PEZI|nr:hypothetical protein B0T21DRAFT_358546 [Apiosordaria backusii]
MSGSLGWADNVILAMAPLGIVTIIVAAIRVGGPPWMKRVIGRGREPLANAEMELMSSTSSDVCELWNGQGLVRVMGKGPIHQFIILPSPSFEYKDVVSAELDSDRASPREEDIGRQGILRSCLDIFSPKSPHSDRVKLHKWRQRHLCKPPFQFNPNGEAKESFIILAKSKSAPNISLNAYGCSKGEMRILAVAGTVLQSAVLAFCGWTASWPHEPESVLLKDGRQVGRYAFPCTAVGTLLLVSGLILCSHVVESRTTEREFSAGDRPKARLLWIQREATVNDQAFDSYALYTDKTPFSLMTSRRAPSITHFPGNNPPPMDNEYGNNIDHADINPDTPLQAKTTIAIALSLCGFVVQFVGLRGMNWSATIAQLIATLVMTGVRAWARREPSESLSAIPLKPGFELDWVALRLGSSGITGKWRRDDSFTPGLWDGRLAIGEPSSYPNEEATNSSRKLSCQRIIQARSCLAKLAGTPAGWPRVAAIEGIKLAQAIQKTLELLEPLYPTGSISWRYTTSSGTTVEMKVDKNGDGKWQVADLANTFEAILSIWLFSVSKQEYNVAHDGHDADPASGNGDTWMTTRRPSLIY